MVDGINGPVKAICTELPCGTDECGISPPDPVCIIIFGASGDLAGRKLVPSLFNLWSNGHMPDEFVVVGAALEGMDDDTFRDMMKDAVAAARPEGLGKSAWDEFSRKLYYITGRFDDDAFYEKLKRELPPLEKKHATTGNRIFYLAIPPTVYETVIVRLGSSGLSRDDNGGYVRISIEKPFGRDTASSLKLSDTLNGSFREDQLYRMDHYLAKENVQNILMFRFANSIFEPLWNRRYIDHIQITVSETLGVEHRAAYYEKAGVLRDMFQSHILQLVALTAMEPPSKFEADMVRDEKVKVMRSIRPVPLDRLEEYVVLGQYGPGEIDGRPVPAYGDEPDVPRTSKTPTYAAMKLLIDNWRWNGVPFYVRSGKRLASRKAEIAISFRRVPHLMFKGVLSEKIEPNTLVMRVQPDEGISLQFQTKTPESKVCLRPVLMDFAYHDGGFRDAYERVLLDCMEGDQMLFVRDDGERCTWEIMTPVIEAIEADPDRHRLHYYPSGSEGPAAAAELLAREADRWRPL